MKLEPSEVGVKQEKEGRGRKRTRRDEEKKEEQGEEKKTMKEEEDDEDHPPAVKTKVEKREVEESKEVKLEEDNEDDDEDNDDGEEEEGDDPELESKAEAAGLSVYEYLRQEQIRKKNERLQQLNLLGLSGELGLRTRPSVPRSSTGSKKRDFATPREGVRRSSRTSVRDPNYVAPPPIYVPEMTTYERAERKEGPILFKDALPRRYEEEFETAYQNVLTAFDKVLFTNDDKYEDLSLKATDLYRQAGAISKSNLRMIGDPNQPGMKVVQVRATTVKVHPTASLTNDFSLVAAGDKDGHVGIARYSNTAPITKWHETFSVAMYAPHAEALLDLQWSARDSHLLYSASRDGSVRALNVAAGQFDEIYVDDSRSSMSGLGIAPDSNTLLVGNRDGEVHLVDVRSGDGARKKRSHTKYVCGTKSIHSCVLNPLDPTMLVTGGLDRVVRAWDIRKFVADQPIKEWQHTQRINSVNFSPSGQHLVSTSYDSTLKLWCCTNSSGSILSADRWRPPTILKHDNVTGRWVTGFRAVFAPHDYAIGIGNMHRSIDVIQLNKSNSAASSSSQPQPPPTEGATLMLHNSEWVTTIPATVAWHPSIVQLVGCTGSGRLYVYGQPH